MRATRPGYDQMHPDDVPPYQPVGQEPRLVHIFSDIDYSKMRCGLLRRAIHCGARDIMDRRLPTCLWCVVGRY